MKNSYEKFVSVKLTDISKKFVTEHGGVVALDSISFVAEAGQITTLLGPSGCGKTTTMRIIAGLERPDNGEVVIGERLVTSTAKKIFVTAEERNLGMVFQSYAVWPHMTVSDNIAYPLRLRKFAKDQIVKRVKEMLAILRIDGLENRYPGQLSGGQQQRVALARALSYNPKVLLLDEPLANLDAKIREQVRFELKELQRELGTTTIYVTHDQSEAMVLSDKVIVMNSGKMLQQGDPLYVYKNPANKFVASFIGHSNLLVGVIKECDKKNILVETTEGQRIVGTSSSIFTPSEECFVSIRPEDIKIHKEKPSNASNVWSCKLITRNFSGSIWDYWFDTEWGKRLRVQGSYNSQLSVGEHAFLSIDRDAVIILSGKDSST